MVGRHEMFLYTRHHCEKSAANTNTTNREQKKKNCENENQQQLFTIPALISKTKTMCKTSLTSQTPRPSSSFTIFNTSAHQTNGKKTHNRTKKKIAKHTKLSLHFNCVAFCCRFYCHFFFAQFRCDAFLPTDARLLSKLNAPTAQSE